MFQQTPQKRVLFPHALAKTMAGGFVAFMLLVTGFTSILSIFSTPPQALAATNSTLNFQARLETASGSIVPDGLYNVEFKLYNVSSAGSSLWTETYFDSNGVTAGNDNRIQVRNGYVSTSLGSLTAFPGTINWDQDLWVTMNIGGTTQTATPTYDGEMNPRLKLTGVPYAFKAGQLAQFNAATGFTSSLSLVQPTVGNQSFQVADQGAAGTYTLCIQNSAACGFAAATNGAGYIQNQTASPQAAGFNINGNGTIGGNFSVGGQIVVTSGGVLQNVTANTSILTAGTLSIARGGTGVAITPTNGQLLIGNGAGYTLATLASTGGLTVTNSAGGISIGTDATICKTTGNCAGSGNGITGTGTTNTIALFTASGTIGNSILTQTGSTIDVSGTIQGTTANFNNFQTNGTTRLDSNGNLTNINNITAGGSLIHRSFNTVIAGTPGWFKMGTIALPQNGYNATIRMYAGTGYNADITQNAQVELNIRTGNTSSTNASGFATSAIATRYGQSGGFASQVKLVGNAAGMSATSYDVYVNTAAFIGMGYYTIDAGVAGSWTESMTTAVDPGVDSATVLNVPFEFYAQSMLYANSAGVGVGTSTLSGYRLNVQGGAANFSNGIDVGSTSVITSGRALQNVTASAGILTSGTVSSGLLTGSYTGITGVGTLTAGTWNAGVIADAYINDTLTIGSASSVAWTALNTYPSACAAGQAITALNDVPTCSTFATTDTNTTYTAGTDLTLIGGAFGLESQIDSVSILSRASSALTLQTTTSGNINLNSAGTIELQDNTNVTGNLAVTGNLNIGATTVLTSGRVLQNVLGYTQSSGSATFNQNAADSFRIAALQAPTTDMFNITNAGFPITVDAINGQQIDYFAALGNAAFQASAQRLNITNTSATAGSITNGLRIVATGAVAGTTNGIKIDNFTSGAGGASALYLGTGWKDLLSYNGTQLINGTGILQSAALNGTYGNVTGVGTLTNLTVSSVIQAPGIDTSAAGTLSVGESNATTVSIGSNNAAHTINIGTGAAAQNITIGSTNGASTTTIQGGTNSVVISGNSSSLTQPVARIIQGGTGDASLEFTNSGTGKQFFIGLDTSTNNFVINSAAAAGGSSQATPTHVQSNATYISGTALSLPLTFASNVTSGNLIVATVQWDKTNTTTATCSDTFATSFTNVTSLTDAPNNQMVLTCYGFAPSSGTDTVTVTFGSTSGYRGMAISEYSGVATSSPVDAFAARVSTNTTAANNVTSNTITTTVPGDLIYNSVSATGFGDPYTAGPGYVMRTPSGKMAVQDEIQVAAGSVSATMTAGTTGSYGSVIIAFKAATTTGGTNTDNLGNPTFSLTQNGAATFGGTVRSTGYQVGSYAGTSVSCTAGQVLVNQVVQGGIVTGGTCASGSSSGGITLQASTPGAADVGNFNITGTGITAALLSGSLDTASAGILAIAGTTATTVNIANNAIAHTIAIGTGAAVQGITIGSTNTTSTLALQGGNGGTAVSISAASGGTLKFGSSNVANTINIGNNGAAGAVAQTINIGTNSTAGATNTIQIGNSSATASTIRIEGGTAPSSVVISTGTGGSVQIGSTNVANNVTIGNNGAAGAFAQTLRIGTNSTAGATNAIQIGNSNATASTIDIQGGTGANAVSISAGSGGTIGFASNAVAQSIAIGNAIGATSLALQAGTGNFTLNGVAGTTYTIGAATTTGTLTVGGATQTGTITIGQSTAQNTINIGAATISAGNIGFINIGNSSTGTGSTSIAIGSTNSTSSLLLAGGTNSAAVAISTGAGGTIGIGANGQSTTVNIGWTGAASAVTQTFNIGNNSNAGANNTINIGSSGSAANSVNIEGGNTGKIQIGNSTAAHTIQIGAGGTAAQDVTIGSTSGASKVTIQAGTNDINLVTNNAGASVLVKSNTDSVSAFDVQNANGMNLFDIDSTVSSGNNLITNPGFETGATTTWVNKGTGTLTAVTTAAAVYQGEWGGNLAMTAATNAGAQFPVTLTLGQTYTIRMWIKAASGTQSNFDMGWVRSGADVSCATGVAIPSTYFTPLDCTFTVTTNAGTAIYIKQTTATARTLYIDSIWVNTSATQLSAVWSGGIHLNGAVTSKVVFQNTNDSYEAFTVNRANGQAAMYIDTARGVTNFVSQPSNATVIMSDGTTGLNFLPGMYYNGAGYTTRANTFNIDMPGIAGTLNISDTIATSQICIANISCVNALGVQGNIAASGSITGFTTPDMAEHIPAAPDVEAADVVMADPNNTERVVKAVGAYNGAAVGVISDGSSTFMINPYGRDDGASFTRTDTKPLVLAGRVPVKVTDEGGPIMPGDNLTTSSTPGYAMKATRAGATIGKALGFFDASTGTGAVLAMINSSYYDPNDGNHLQSQSASFDTLQAGSASFGSLNVTGPTTLSDLTVTGDATFQGDLVVRGAVTVQSLTVQGHIATAGDKPLAVLLDAAGKPQMNQNGQLVAGSEADVTLEGNDTAGKITITMGAADVGPGEFVRIAFTKPFSSAPRVLISPIGKDGAMLSPYVDQTANEMIVGGLGTPEPGKTYSFNYFAVE